MMSRAAYVVLCSFLLACRPADQAAESNTPVATDTTPAPAPAVPPDVYTTRIAIFVDADSMTTEERKKYTEEELETIFDDGNWYRSEAWTFLDSIGIKYVSAE